jgi:hypothetical protein
MLGASDDIPQGAGEAVETRGVRQSGLIGPKLRFWPSWRTFRECVLSD